LNEQRTLEPGRASSWTITQFMTDGSLVALLRELATLSGCAVRLYACDGALVEMSAGDPPWTESEEGVLGPRVRELLDGDDPDLPLEHEGWSVVPLRVRRVSCGAIAIMGEAPMRQRAVRLVERLAPAVSELCEQAVELRERSDELALIFELSSLLMTTHDVRQVAEVALRSAVWILGVDAGTVHLADADGELRLQATFGLSPEFASAIEALPADRIVDANAMRGDIVVIDDLVEDGRSYLLDELRDEGLVSLLSTGLVFSKQPLGLMRLYTKRPAAFAERECELLRTVAEQVASAVQGARLIERQRRERRERRHMRLAGDIQRRMLPSRLPDGFPRLDLGARYVSSFDVGGDFYDLMPFAHSLGLALGDVVGKGVPAALLMGSLRASLRAHAADIYHIDDIVARVNRDLCQYTLPNEFATLFYGVIDHVSLRLTFCNAGHEPPVVFRPRRGAEPEVFTLETGGMVVGIGEDTPYEAGIFDLKPGDVLLGITDGLTEAMNPDGEMYGRTRLRAEAMAFLAEHPSSPAQSLVDHLLWCVRRFVGLAGETDDVTLVGVRVRE